MAAEQYLILILIGVILLQGAFIAYSSHKFVNKIMSRSYDEYKRAQVVQPKEQRVKLQNNNEEYSELGVL